MSRFSGWTMADIDRLYSCNIKVGKSKKSLHKVSGTDYVGRICTALSALKIEHVREYKFLHDRRFRFDIAIPSKMIAIEFEGGIWSNGRHTRGKGYSSDCKKYNLALMYDWKLLRYTTEDTKTEMWEYKIADEIKKLAEHIKI